MYFPWKKLYPVTAGGSVFITVCHNTYGNHIRHQTFITHPVKTTREFDHPSPVQDFIPGQHYKIFKIDGCNVLKFCYYLYIIIFILCKIKIKCK
ncbi:hypothetical protein Glove_311g55 [Diversispora epigaea]|uniref:Uncharacterized protein n=1 Tax=Diversispora epigaea TaxID=1348612 RepID=A0A397HX55_9GLOM|nr:hypothetical protein Glove_311g55 [Diversispora epigaea]